MPILCVYLCSLVMSSSLCRLEELRETVRTVVSIARVLQKNRGEILYASMDRTFVPG